MKGHLCCFRSCYYLVSFPLCSFNRFCSWDCAFPFLAEFQMGAICQFYAVPVVYEISRSSSHVTATLQKKGAYLCYLTVGLISDYDHKYCSKIMSLNCMLFSACVLLTSAQQAVGFSIHISRILIRFHGYQYIFLISMRFYTLSTALRAMVSIFLSTYILIKMALLFPFLFFPAQNVQYQNPLP